MHVLRAIGVVKTGIQFRSLCLLGVLLNGLHVSTIWAQQGSSPPVRLESAESADPGLIPVSDLAKVSATAVDEFVQANPGHKLYVLNHPMVSDQQSKSLPSLRLNRFWSSSGRVLLEIEGLPVQGRLASAIIRQDTFTLSNKKTAVQPKWVVGVSRQIDPRGGEALVVEPGQKMMVYFEGMDDFNPMQLGHRTHDNKEFVYFENIDPRFQERYDLRYQQVMGKDSTPELMKDFLVDFAGNDPQKRSLEVFLKLINEMRAQNTFEGYYNAYLLIKDPNDALKAQALVRNDEQRKKLEYMAVATLVSKDRLFNFDFVLSPTQSSTREGSCWMACVYNMTATRVIRGALSLSPNPSSPIKLSMGKYKVVFQVQVSQPRHTKRKSRWLGDYDGSDDQTINRDIGVVVSPPDYRWSGSVDLAAVDLAFLQRGTMGGVEGTWATGDASLRLKIKNVELVNSP